MKKGALWEEEQRLKTNIIIKLESEFVDQFDKWKERCYLFNRIVVEYNRMSKKRLHPITYDQYCKLFVSGSKDLLDQHIKMHDIVPTKEEMDGMKGSIAKVDDANDFKQRYTSLLEAKYATVKKTLAALWDDHVFKYMIVARYGLQHIDSILAVKKEVINGVE